MTVWNTTQSGARYWPGVNLSASWRYDSNGDISAQRNGVELSLSGANWLSRARSLVAKHGPGVFATTNDPFYQRALLSLSLHEDPTGELPAWGDCWCIDNPKQVCPCGSATAGPPTAVGLYGAQRRTLESIGFNWEEMAKDPMKNHQFAIALAKKTEDKHGKDFPTLAGIWGAGGIYNQDSSDWGNRTYDPHVLTEQVKGWNAIGQALRETSVSPASWPATPSTDNPLGLIAAAMFVLNGFRIGRFLNS